MPVTWACLVLLYVTIITTSKFKQGSRVGTNGLADARDEDDCVFLVKTKQHYLGNFGSAPYNFRVLYILRIALAIYGLHALLARQH